MSKEIKELFSKQDLERNKLFKELIEKGELNYSPRANKFETRIAYTNVLETGNKANDALTWVEESEDKPEGWAESIKHSSVPKKFINYSIDYHKDHPVTVAMESEGVLNREGKRSLRQSSTLSSFLNTLSSQVKMTEELINLKQTVNALTVNAIETNERLDALEDSMQIDKEKALHLMEKGYNNNRIQKLSGKHRSTIARWRKEFNQNKS
jgi:hypothetical protein